MRFIIPSLLLVLCVAACGFKGPLSLSKDEKAKSAQKPETAPAVPPKEDAMP